MSRAERRGPEPDRQSDDMGMLAIVDSPTFFGNLCSNQPTPYYSPHVVRERAVLAWAVE